MRFANDIAQSRRPPPACRLLRLASLPLFPLYIKDRREGHPPMEQYSSPRSVSLGESTPRSANSSKQCPLRLPPCYTSRKGFRYAAHSGLPVGMLRAALGRLRWGWDNRPRLAASSCPCFYAPHKAQTCFTPPDLRRAISRTNGSAGSTPAGRRLKHPASGRRSACVTPPPSLPPPACRLLRWASAPLSVIQQTRTSIC